MVGLLGVVIGRLLCSRLLSNLILHLVDRVLFQFLSDLFFFTLPLIFKSMGTVSLIFLNHHGGLLLVTVLGHVDKVEKGVFKHLEVAHLL